MPYLSSGRFAVIAHRGGSLEAPENTLQAFENAFQIFPQIYFELDVHLTRDEEVVVTHDDSVDRTTNGHGAVKDLTLNELSKLDWGFNFSKDGGKTFPFRGKGVSISRLSDIFEKFPKNPITVEIKHGPKFFGQKVVDIIRKYNAQDRVCISGENHEDLTKTSKLLPDLCSGYSGHELLLNFIWNRFRVPFLGPNRGDVMQIPYIHNGYLVASPSFIGRAHRRNKVVHVWTVNDEVTMRHLVEIGADGIITDAPTLLLKVARELKKI